MDQSLALRFSFDSFCCVISTRSILSPVDITTFSLSCGTTYLWFIKYISQGAVTGGYPKRPSLMATFTCYCGRVAWDILQRCDCFIECNYCRRKFPNGLASQRWLVPGNRYCGFPCESGCGHCHNIINEHSAGEFKFANGMLFCAKHPIPKHIPPPFGMPKDSRTNSVFGAELAGVDHGPIPWLTIANYDPTHGILRWCPVTSK